MKRFFGIAMIALAAIGFVESASADVLNLAPTQAVVLPEVEGAPTRVALLFDLLSIPGGEGGTISAAVLDWRISGAPQDRRSTYAAFAASAGWNSGSVAGGASVALDEVATSEWELEVLDLERLGGGLLRLDLTALVRAWTTGVRANYGVVVQTPDVSREGLSQDLSQAALTVYYRPAE
jgi:hypothetical protein